MAAGFKEKVKSPSDRISADWITMRDVVNFTEERSNFNELIFNIQDTKTIYASDFVNGKVIDYSDLIWNFSETYSSPITFEVNDVILINIQSNFKDSNIKIDDLKINWVNDDWFFNSQTNALFLYVEYTYLSSNAENLNPEENIEIEYTFTFKVSHNLNKKQNWTRIRYYNGRNQLLNSNENPVYFKNGSIEEINLRDNLFELMYGGKHNSNNISVDTEIKPNKVNLTINNIAIEELKEIGFDPDVQQSSWSFAIIENNKDMNPATGEGEQING